MSSGGEATAEAELTAERAYLAAAHAALRGMHVRARPTASGTASKAARIRSPNTFPPRVCGWRPTPWRRSDRRPVWVLVAIAVVAGTARGIATLLQATAVSDRWGTTAYGTLSGILAAPVTAASALAPWVGAALAGPLGGYPQTFAALGVVAVLTVALAAGSVPVRRAVA